MITISIKEKNILKIIDETENETFGSNQDWYTKKWQRMAGCGPSTVTNIIYYLNNRQSGMPCCPGLTRKDCLQLMDEIWNYVTPGLGGVSSTGMLGKGVQKYLLEKKLNINLDFLDIPKKQKQRPEVQQVITFLAKTLEKDSPLAFLNLEHGDIVELESWHWVTIISLDYDLDAKAAYAIILDCGTEKRINLTSWLETTKLGGGFVSFEA